MCKYLNNKKEKCVLHDEWNREADAKGYQEKQMGLNGFFASVFIHNTEIPETREKAWSQKNLFLMEEEKVRENLKKLYIYKDSNLDRM